MCATNVGSAKALLAKKTFTTVLMDEAAMATEPVALIPITHKGVSRVVLVGDHRQLPPTVISELAEYEGLGQSLFGRLVKCKVPPKVLNTQYRMHPSIAEFPSQTFYDGELNSGTPANERTPPCGFQWTSETFPIAFIDVQGSDEKINNSFINDKEAEKVLELLKKLRYGNDLSPCQIGIVAPYARQVLNIKNRLHRIDNTKWFQSVDVGTADGFQGKEKDLIIVSITRANKHRSLGFVKDRRRMNVALTRAKRGVIVIGDKNMLENDSDGWRKWLHWVEKDREKQHSRRRQR